MELIKQGGSAAAASAAPASGSASVSGGNAGLGDFAFSGATKTYTGGGVTMTTLPQYAALHPGIIISGGALGKAPDLRKAVLEMEAALK